jgi:uncharacterized protein YhaN
MSKSSSNSEDKHINSTTTEIPPKENLLQRADDIQLRKTMQDLDERIDQHCESYYHQLRVLDSTQKEIEQQLNGRDYSYLFAPEFASAELAQTLQNSQTRVLAVRRIIAMVLFHISIGKLTKDCHYFRHK